MAAKDKTAALAEVAEQVKEDINNEEFSFDPNYNPDIQYVEGMTLIPSGCKVLDIACSDRKEGAFALGRYTNLIGDSSTGKSILALSMLAECSRLPFFDKYNFIYDDAEQANSFDMYKLFGGKLVNRLQAPRYDKNGEPLHSNTIQDFNLHINNAIDAGKPFIYILDSFDSLTSLAEIETNDKMLKNMRDEKKDDTGSYGMDKPKIIGQILRQIVGKLERTDSFLLIISQTRDNVSPMSFAPKTRSGGRALKFYASHEIWLANVRTYKRTVKGLDRDIGVCTRAKITKNKLTGKSRIVDFNIFYEYGVDDLKSCLDFLVSTKSIEQEKKSFVIAEWGFTGTEEKLISFIENNNKEQEFFEMYYKAWMDIENALKIERKPKYE